MIQSREPDDAGVRRHLTVAILLLAGLLGAGCGSGERAAARASAPTAGLRDNSTIVDGTTATTNADSEPAEETPDVCDVVSDDVAAEVLGVEIVRRESHGEPGSTNISCIKGTSRPSGPVSDLSGTFYVSVAQVAGAAALVDEASQEEGSQPVDGVGDRAVFLPSAGVLYIAVGPDEIQVQVIKAGLPGGLDDCAAIADDILERRG